MVLLVADFASSMQAPTLAQAAAWILVAAAGCFLGADTFSPVEVRMPRNLSGPVHSRSSDSESECECDSEE